MVLGEVSVEVLGGDELQYRVAEELEPLVGAQRQVVEADAAVGEGARQQTDVHKLHPHLLLELPHLLEHAHSDNTVSTETRAGRQHGHLNRRNAG